ncbi:MAG: hypothetical protein IKD27_08140 [Oscillospiraceae bacterium]|nr:hypothetical protein [Oscillospiraceae bacterium]
MIATDRDALVCDLAETYGIFEMGALPVKLLATLASGLRADSRIRMKMAGSEVTQMELLTAAVVDRLSMLWWAKTEDGRNGINRPRSLVKVFTGQEQEKQPSSGFDTAEEFEAEWERMTGVRHGG